MCTEASKLLLLKRNTSIELVTKSTRTKANIAWRVDCEND